MTHIGQEITSSRSRGGLYRSFGKRLFDLVVAAPTLILLSPALAILALLVRIKMGAPVFFRQTRPGYRGRPFEPCKFRTMLDTRDADGEVLADVDRLPSLGRVLRSTSLDELPQLWNVVKGEMSLVGPRPLLLEYLPYYTEREQVRHSVRPGVTGLAQISGRNRLPWDERLELDARYAETLSFSLDLAILFKTVRLVIGRRDVVDVSTRGEPNLGSYRRGQLCADGAERELEHETER